MHELEKLLADTVTNQGVEPFAESGEHATLPDAASHQAPLLTLANLRPVPSHAPTLHPNAPHPTVRGCFHALTITKRLDLFDCDLVQPRPAYKNLAVATKQITGLDGAIANVRRLASLWCDARALTVGERCARSAIPRHHH